jgi:ATP-dependent Clp protease ATP-binding subunit ClpC
MLEDPLSEELLKGNFQGKDTINVRVHEVDGEKKLMFDATLGAGAGELVGAGTEAKS